MTTAVRTSGGSSTVPAPRRRGHRLLVDHAPFLAALLLGVLVRVVVVLAFPRALMVSDAPGYLTFLDDPTPSLERPDGYGILLLLPLSLVADSLTLYTTVQHALGLVAASALYAVLRRWGVGRWWAATAVLPVLLDPMLLLLEHTTLSDALFLDLVVLAVVLLGWRRRSSPAVALAAGLAMGLATVVRQVGTPLVLAGVVFVLLAGAGRWRRVATALALVVGFAAPVGAYAAWYQSTHGTYALSGIGPTSAYMRTTTFVECDRLDLEPYAQVLCPPEPVGERRDPTDYGWYEIGVGARSLTTPPDVDRDAVLGDFAQQALAAQPLDYVRVVLRDAVLGFDVIRTDRFEYNTTFKWRFSHYLDPPSSPWSRMGWAGYGGEPPDPVQPWADLVVGYQRVVWTPGPVVLVGLVLGVVGAVSRRAGAVRPYLLLLVLVGFGLSLLPALTTEFIWRYQLPGVLLLPVAGVLAGSALRHRGPRRCP